MPRFLKSLLPFILCIIGGTLWIASQVAIDTRDWLNSDTWVATQSTRLTIQPKTSTVIYDYEVDGQTYTNRRTLFFVGALYDDARHLAWLNAHRQATAVTVYYDPIAPEQAVLVREVPSTLFLEWIFTIGYVGFVCLLPGLFFGAVWWWLRRQFL